METDQNKQSLKLNVTRDFYSNDHSENSVGFLHKSQF